MYKAKLAEQAERCARRESIDRSARVKARDGHRSGRRPGVSSTMARDARTRPNARRPRARARDDRARDRSSASRVESSRVGSIRSIDRTNDRTNGRRSNERTIDARRVMRVDARAVRGRRRVRGWWAGKGWRTRDEGRIDAVPSVRDVHEVVNLERGGNGVRIEAV